MAWIAVDDDSEVYIYDKKPIRGIYGWSSIGSEVTEISDYATQLLLGRDLTWDDEPVEIKAV